LAPGGGGGGGHPKKLFFKKLTKPDNSDKKIINIIKIGKLQM